MRDLDIRVHVRNKITDNLFMFDNSGRNACARIVNHIVDGVVAKTTGHQVAAASSSLASSTHLDSYSLRFSSCNTDRPLCAAC